MDRQTNIRDSYYKANACPRANDSIKCDSVPNTYKKIKSN